MQTKAIAGLVDLTTKDRFDAIDEKLKYLPTKEEFFNKMDEVMTELKRSRQEDVMMGSRVSRLEECVREIKAVNQEV